MATKPTKRTLPGQHTVNFGRDQTKGIKLFRDYLSVTNSRLDAFSVTLGAIVLRSLLPAYRKKPAKYGFREVLASSLSPGPETIPGPGIESAAKTARTFQLRYKDGCLPEELRNWVEKDINKRTAGKTSPAVFQRLADNLESAFNFVSLRLTAQPIQKLAISLDRLISQEALLPRSSVSTGFPESGDAVDSEDVESARHTGSTQDPNHGTNSGEMGHNVDEGDAENSNAGGPEDLTEADAEADVSRKTQGAQFFQGAQVLETNMILKSYPPREDGLHNDTGEETTDCVGLVSWPNTWKVRPWVPQELTSSCSDLPKRKTRQPDQRSEPVRYEGFEKDVEAVLKGTCTNCRIKLGNGTVVAAIAGRECGLPVPTQALLLDTLQRWKANPEAHIPGGALHFGIKRPLGGKEMQVCAELNNCGRLARTYLRDLQQLLLASGAVPLLEWFAKLVNPRLFQLQAAVMRHLSADPVLATGLPLGNAWEYRVLNLNMIAAKSHCDPGDFGFTFILVLGIFEEHFLCVPETGYKLRVAPGSMVALPSAYFDHFVSQFQGEDRYSIVFICSRSSIRQLRLFNCDEIEL